MDFNEKLQALRKQKGLTQEELAEALFVSRTAVSKWESGRGFPNIESLKAISNLFSVSIDELLSGEQLLFIAENESEQKRENIRDLIYGLLDLSSALFLFLPIFANRVNGEIYEASLLALSGVSTFLKVGYITLVSIMILWGIIILASQNFGGVKWKNIRVRISLLLSIFGMLSFTLSLQPYGAVLLFVFLIIKVLMLKK